MESGYVTKCGEAHQSPEGGIIFGGSSFTAATVVSGSIPKKGPKKGLQIFIPNPGGVGIKKTAWKHMKLTMTI